MDNMENNKPEMPAIDNTITTENALSESDIPQKGLVGKIKSLDNKYKIIIVVVISVILIFALVAILMWWNNGHVYNEAEQLLKEKKYDNALETLQPLVDKEYKDSKTLKKYVKARKELDKADTTSSNSYVEMTAAYDSAATSFAAIKDFRDSKQYAAYADASKSLRTCNTFTTDYFLSYADEFGEAGDINGSDSLSAFFKNLNEKKYTDAAASAKEYIDGGGEFLGANTIKLIANAGPPYNSQLTDTEKINTQLGLLNMGFTLDQKIFSDLENGYNSKLVKSFKLKGMGSNPQGKVLVISKVKPYKGSAEYNVNISYTSKFGKDRFPGSIQEVEYVVRIYENSKFKSWYTGGGKKVPGVTQTIYAELYNTKKKKVVAKTKVKNGPGLKSQYTYSGSPPSVIVPDWIKKDAAKKKLVNEMVKKVN